MVRENTAIQTPTTSYSFERPAGSFTANFNRAPIGEDQPNVESLNSQSVDAVQRFNRIFGQKSRGTSNTMIGFGILGAKKGATALFTANTNGQLDENTKQSLEGLKKATQVVGSLLKSMGWSGLGLFAAEAGLTAADIKSDAKRALSGGADKAISEVAEQGAEVAVKSGAGVAAEAASSGAKTLSKGLSHVFKAAAKHIPLAGAGITGYFAFQEIQHFRETGETHLAKAAGVVGALETAGNLMTFGLAGDFFREAARGLFVRFGGDDYAQLQKSDVRYVAETARDLAGEFKQAVTGQAPVIARQIGPSLNFG